MKVCLAGCVLAAVAATAAPLRAQGHGPIYGLSTPTLGRGGWSLDVGAMGRFLGEGRLVMIRPMLSYGITKDLQAYGSLPVPIQRDRNIPPIRGFTRMPATRDLEVGLGWRFQRRGLGVGTRQETTLWMAVDQPLDQTRAGLPTSAGGFAALVSGYASRTVYAWAGGAYRRYAGRDDARVGDVAMASLVLGYRPQLFRDEYPSPDWRGFLELVGEWIDSDTINGTRLPGTGGRQLFMALTVLGLYGSWGIAGGPAFPLIQDMHGDQPEERVRLAVNLTLWW